MKDYIKVNKKWWNNVTRIHANSKLYDLENFKKGKSHLESIELEEAGNVRGKTLLHLMCHFGMGTLQWARLGATATGVDFSEDAIKLAKKLSQDTNIHATFIQADVYDLTNVLNEKFDIIFMSYGVLLWLSDIKTWAKLVHRFLKKGGMLYIVELHPFTNMLNHNLKMDYDYFDRGPHEDDSSGTYADWSAKIKGTTYIWSYTLSDIINALLENGLNIEFVHEFPFTVYDQFPGHMTKDKNGHYVLKQKDIQIPLLFSLKATK